jgi:hypothetical protein
MLKFCLLDDSPKNYEFIRNFISSTSLNFFKLDNQIQVNEIKYHLGLCHIDNKEEANEETLNWIEKNAEGFRLYLDTLHIVFLIWNFIGKDSQDLTYEMYLEIKEKLNIINKKMGNLK